MYAAAASTAPPPAAKAPTPAPEVRQSVASLLTRSDAFRRMPPSDQQELAQQPALIADYLARPEGIEGNRIPGGVGTPAQALAGEDKSAAEATWAQRQAAVDAIGGEKFQAKAAREGAKVAGMLLNEVKFPAFVSGLIEGVFSSIVSSIDRADGGLSEDDRARSPSRCSQFMDDNVTENQGRDNMVEQVPRPVRDRHRRLVRAMAASPG